MSETDILSKEKVYLNHLSTKCSFSGSYIFSFMFVSKHYWIYTFKKVSCQLLFIGLLHYMSLNSNFTVKDMLPNTKGFPGRQETEMENGNTMPAGGGKMTLQFKKKLFSSPILCLKKKILLYY